MFQNLKRYLVENIFIIIVFAVFVFTNYIIPLDVNECEISKGGCQHICKNTYGSYICQCKNGFSLNANEKSCSGKLEIEIRNEIKKSQLFNLVLSKVRVYETTFSNDIPWAL